jgi:hypothetical protein
VGIRLVGDGARDFLERVAISACATSSSFRSFATSSSRFCGCWWPSGDTMGKIFGLDKVRYLCCGVWRGRDSEVVGW